MTTTAKHMMEKMDTMMVDTKMTITTMPTGMLAMMTTIDTMTPATMMLT